MPQSAALLLYISHFITSFHSIAKLGLLFSWILPLHCLVYFPICQATSLKELPRRGLWGGHLF